MLPAMTAGLHTRPVTPPTQTTTSDCASCEAHFKKGEFTAFKLMANFRSGIRLNLKKTPKTINNKHTQAGLCLSFSICFSACARVTYWISFLCFANVFSLISPDIITPVSEATRHGCCQATGLGDQDSPLSNTGIQLALPTHQGEGIFLSTCQPAIKTCTPSPHPPTNHPSFLPSFLLVHWPTRSDVTQTQVSQLSHDTGAMESGNCSTEGQSFLKCRHWKTKPE